MSASSPQLKTSSEVELNVCLKTSSEVELMETRTSLRLMYAIQELKTSSEVELMET